MSAALPVAILDGLLALIMSQLCYAFFPYRRRVYWPALALAALGILLGQLWDYLGIPAWRLGGAALLPGALFAVALQPLARRITR